jgi:hypothetical protein
MAIEKSSQEALRAMEEIRALKAREVPLVALV